MGRRHRQHGFALLMTLLILAIAAVALADLGRRSAREALSALRAQEDLQHRWAVRSAEDVLLPQAEALFAAEQQDIQEQPASPAPLDVPGPTIRRTVVLGGSSVELWFTDEQAKLNPNALLARRGPQVAAQHMHRVAIAAQVRQFPAPHPLGDFERRLHEAAEPWPAFSSFEQLLPGTLPEQLIGPGDGIADHRAAGAGAFAELVTLWGDGRVHWRRAPRQVLEAALEPDLGPGPAQRLMQVRREEPQLSIDQALGRLDLNDRQRRNVRGRLSDDSGCFGLWIVQRTEHRDRHRLLVREQPQEGPPITRRLIW